MDEAKRCSATRWSAPLLVARNAGAKIFLVHAMDEPAKRFYLNHDFEVSPVDELTLMLLVQDIPGA